MSQEQETAMYDQPIEDEEPLDVELHAKLVDERAEAIADIKAYWASNPFEGHNYDPYKHLDFHTVCGFWHHSDANCEDQEGWLPE